MANPPSSGWSLTVGSSAPEQPKSQATPWGGLPGRPDLLEDEYRPAYEAYAKDPSPKNADQFLGAIQPVLSESLRSYAGTEAGTATARARAKVLALQAVRRYDPQRAKLRTHLLSHLRGLRRATERSTSGLYVPEAWRLDSRVTSAVSADLRDELGREPSDAEVADRSKIPIARVRRAASVPGVLAGGHYEGQLAISSPNERAWNQWVEGVYHDLGPVDQVILQHSFGLHGKEIKPANHIAKMVNLSPGAVSQRKAKIQNMLDEYGSFMGQTSN